MSDVLKQMASAGSIDLSKAVKDNNYGTVVDQIHDEIVLNVDTYGNTIPVSFIKEQMQKACDTNNHGIVRALSFLLYAWREYNEQDGTIHNTNIPYSPHAAAQITCCKDCDEWSQDTEKYPLRNMEEGFCCVHHCFTGHQYYCGDARRKNNEQIH